MSCQQVPRITEDPYTFTDATPTTATLFNPQIHKLTPIIHQNTNVRQFLPKKTQIINQHPRIFNTTNNTKNSNIKTPKAVSVVGRLNGIPVSITSSNNVVNGLHKITTNSSSLPSINLIKSQNNFQTSQNNVNSLVVSKAALTAASTPILKGHGDSTQVQQHNQITQTQPQILTLNQSHPLYSIARQTQIVTTSTTQGNVVSQALPGNQQQKQSSNPPQNIKQKQALNANSSAQVSEPFNELVQKTVIKKHSNGNVSSNSIPSIPNTLNSSASPNLEQTPALQQPQALTQRLPASNFAQPQQIKQLASNNGSEIIKVNALESQCLTKKPKSPTLHSLNAKKRKISEEFSINNALSVTPSSFIEKPSDKPVFATPPAKRDARALSAGSTNGKLKGANQNNSLIGNPSNVSTSNKTHNLVRTKRAYSQSSHNETLQRIPVSYKAPAEWHAPDSYVFDSLGPFSTSDFKENGQVNTFRFDKLHIYSSRRASGEESSKLQVQKHWLKIEDFKNSLPAWSQGREKRIELLKSQLRRQAMQYFSARQFLSPLNARKRLAFVSQALKKFGTIRNECYPSRICSVSSCNNTALALTSYCNLHITKNNDQHLFLPCTAKFSDNTQCRIPVFDITHNLPLCKEHAWKRDNYQRIIQDNKPSKAARKRTKSGALTKNDGNTLSNHKRSKRKRKPLLASDSGLGGMEISNNSADGIISSSSDVGSGSMEESGEGQKMQHELCSSNSITSFADYSVQSSKSDFMNHLISNDVLTTAQMTTLQTETKDNIVKNDKLLDRNDTTQDSFNVCENSSAYESSEDTGFGALSDAELIAGANEIEEIPLGDTRLLEETDLTNVLNQLPVDAINEFLTTVQQNGPSEPTQEEQDYLERALELANKQVQEQMNQMVGQQIEQMAVEGDQIDPNFLESFLVDNLDADICTEIVYSPDGNDLDANHLLIDAESNGTTGSNSCNDSSPNIDIRNLVQT